MAVQWTYEHRVHRVADAFRSKKSPSALLMYMCYYLCIGIYVYVPTHIYINNIYIYIYIYVILHIYIYTYCYGSISLALALIGRDGGLSTLCHRCRFACQQKVLKTFPGAGFLRSEDGVVWLWHILLNL